MAFCRAILLQLGLCFPALCHAVQLIQRHARLHGHTEINGRKLWHVSNKLLRRPRRHWRHRTIDNWYALDKLLKPAGHWGFLWGKAEEKARNLGKDLSLTPCSWVIWSGRFVFPFAELFEWLADLLQARSGDSGLMSLETTLDGGAMTSAWSEARKYVAVTFPYSYVCICIYIYIQDYISSGLSILACSSYWCQGRAATNRTVDFDVWSSIPQDWHVSSLQSGASF